MKQHLFKFAIVVVELMVNAVLASGQVVEQVSSDCFT